MEPSMMKRSDAAPDFANSSFSRPKLDLTSCDSPARILTAVAREPGIEIRDLASRTGETEEEVEKIVNDLSEAHYLLVTKRGMKHRYQVLPQAVVHACPVNPITVGDI